MRKIHKDVPYLFKPYPWKVVEEKFEQETNSINETIFTIANGYIGIRGFFEEGFYGIPMHTMRTTMINGIYEYFPYNHIWCRPGFPSRYHSILNQTDPFDLKVYLDNELVMLSNEKVSNYSRSLDLKTGEVERKFDYKTDSNKIVSLSYKRFCSQIDKHLAFMSLDIKCNDDVKVVLDSKLDSIVAKSDSGKPEIGGAQGNVYHFRETRRENNVMLVGYDTNTTNFEVTCGVHEYLNKKHIRELKDTDSGLNTIYKFDGSIHYERTICFTTNREFTNHVDVCLEKLTNEARNGYKANLELTTQEWNKFWNLSAIDIDSDDAINQGIHFSMFHIYQSTGKDGITNISANGLTGTGYSGHTFWDTEIFMMPMYIYTAPEIAKKLIEYRYNILPNAKKRAAEMDDVGALFAWNSINGEECGHVFEAATAQYHIDPDIYYAIHSYYQATNDLDFMVNYCDEILFEMCKCLSHRGFFSEEKDGKFVINVICGPDEYNPVVDNNLYTNMLTKKMMEFTLKMKDVLKEKYPAKLEELMKKCEVDEEEFTRWENVAKNMYLGYSKKHEIYLQDDNFLNKDPIDVDSIPVDKLPLLTHLHPLNLWRYQVIKQADIVLLTFLESQEFTLEMRKKIFDFYEPKTIHDSSLSAGIHSIVACDIGYQEEAYQYLKQSCRMDLDNVNRNTYFGIHAACMGTSWMMIVNGYGGLRAYDDTLHFKPYCDKKWKSVSFKVLFKGTVLKVSIYQDKVIYEVEEGNDITIYHFDTKLEFKKNKKKEVSLC